MATKRKRVPRKPTIRRRAKPATDDGIGVAALRKQLNDARRNLSEALQHQTATADVLKIISQSAFDLQTVLETLTKSAASLCEAEMSGFVRPTDNGYNWVTSLGFPPACKDYISTLQLSPRRGSAVGRALLEGRPTHIHDVLDDPEFAYFEAQRLGGFRTVLATPLLSQGAPIGVFFLSRRAPRPFSQEQIKLASTFADQAAIAIENTRLLNELRQRTDDLSEALEQQTATSEVLRVISSSPGDLAPVFHAMLGNALRICEARFGNLFLWDAGSYRAVTVLGEPGYVASWQRDPLVVLRDNPGVPLDLLTRSKDIIHIPDLTAMEGSRSNPRMIALIETAGARTLLGVPMLKDGDLVGAIVIYRQEVRPFTDKQIALLTNFAAQAVIAIENTRLLNELRERTDDLSESLEQQTATSEVLRVISSSPGELNPVFDALLANAVRICDARFGVLLLSEGDAFRYVAVHGAPPAFAEARRREPVVRVKPGTTVGRVAATKKPAQTADIRAEPAYTGDPKRIPILELAGARTVLVVPMLKDNELIGAIGIYRQEVRPFNDKQIELLTNFAAQAVIAIENTRLLSELRETLKRQTATSEVLRVISSSPGELRPVFETMLAKTTELCEASHGALWLCEGDGFRCAAFHGDLATAFFEQWRVGTVFHFGPTVAAVRAVKLRKPVQESDLKASAAYRAHEPLSVTAVDVAGIRTLLAVPMLKENEPIGVIAIYRREVRPFTDKQVELVLNFASQAVIAIENTRLLNELRESLQQQTATADVLKVISRSTFDLQTVLDALSESAVRLCEAERAYIFRFDGEVLQAVACYNVGPENKEWVYRNPIRPGRHSVSGRAALERRSVQVPDVQSDPEYGYVVRDVDPIRTTLAVPMLKGDQLVGTITIYRLEVRLFTDKEIALVETFADQAAIAIENTRLFSEVQARTEDLAESLQQQTATSEVLQVISSSPGDLDPVFRAMLKNALRICEASFGNLFLWESDSFRVVTVLGDPAYVASWERDPIVVIRENPGIPLDLLTRSKKTIQITDLTEMDIYKTGTNRRMAALVDTAGARTLLEVPMLKDGELVGAIVIYRKEVRPFSGKQIELVMNFAAQAVIAIENTRLLNELRESLQQQTATADVLKVISRSAFDLETVLQTLVESAAQLCEADQGVIVQSKGDNVFHRTAAVGFSREFTEQIRDMPVTPERGSAVGRALLERRMIHIPDVDADPNYTFEDAKRLGGLRTVLALPMLREGMAIGVLALTRTIPQPFTEKQIELAQTFADQAAIAIENVRLFDQVQARTRELTASLEDLRTAQDRLVQTEKLASLGQLTAGIAHEIKNPLNFVNNFSAVSTELVDELREALAGAHLDDKLRVQINEIADMLQGNLDKVVQHGKRADSIVKNMLLHARRGSAEHRPVDINALVEESLNLAYHGARAEKQGFNVTLERSLDPTAGEVDVFPQEITRVLLNLISNGFYAATKRKSEQPDGGYEPALSAVTKDLGDSVEIRIRDNGTGIPPDVKEKIFHPFFTTKSAGEGTGLGLSLSHDIVVKQHAGTIEVDTQPGEYTEFRIILPRRAATIAKSGGHS